MERFEARVRDEPGQLWGVWDNATETWRETLLRTSEETDARHSAELLNATPASYRATLGILINRPPTVGPWFFLFIANGFGVCAGQVLFNWGTLNALFFVIGAVSLLAALWKLHQVMRWTPEAIVKRSIEPDDEEDADDDTPGK